MTVNVQQYEYVKQAGDTAGIMAVILPQYQMPFPEDDGTMISPGHATSIGIIQVGLIRVVLCFSCLFVCLSGVLFDSLLCMLYPCYLLISDTNGDACMQLPINGNSQHP